MKLATVVAAAALVLGVSVVSAAPAAAAIIPATGLTTVELFLPADLIALRGTATLNPDGTVSFPITGIETVADGTRVYHDGSGLRIGDAVNVDNFVFTAPLPSRLFANVNGGDDEFPLFDLTDTGSILLTSETAGVLNDLFDTDDFEAEAAVGRVVSTTPTAVPEPTSLVLLGGALAVAARRLRLRK